MVAQLLVLITILWVKTTVDLSRNKDTLEILVISFQILSEILTCVSKTISFHYLAIGQLLEDQSLFMLKKMIWVKKETNNH